MVAQDARPDAGVRGDIGDQHAGAGTVGAGHHGCLPHPVVRRERGLHFAGLDPVTPHLHLLVGTPEEVQPVLAQHHEVAGAVPDAAARGRPEPLRGEVGAMQVPLRDTNSGQEELARRSRRDFPPLVVEHHRGHAVDRAADGRQVGPGLRVAAELECRRHMGFGRPVLVLQHAAGHPLEQRADRRSQHELLARGDDLAQGGRWRLVFEPDRERLQGDIGQEQPLDRARVQHRAEPFRIAPGLVVDHDERPAAGPCVEELLYRHVEAQRGEMQGPARRTRTVTALPAD